MRFCVLKRDFRLFLCCLLPAAALTVVFSVVCVAAALVGIKGAGAAYTPVKAAVVNGEDSLLSRLAVNTIAGTDYIAPLMEVSVCGLDEAMEGLQAGELAAVILLPEGTVDGILSGTDTRGTIWLSPAAAAHADVVAGVASFGELLLAAGQYGIFSGQQLIWSQELDARFQADFLKTYNARLLGEAINAQDRYFDLRVTDYADTNLSAEGWYAACWLALLLLLTALFFSRLYTADLKKPILCRLRGLGMRDGAFLAGKVLGEEKLRPALLMLLPCLFLTGFENIFKSAFHGIKYILPPIVSELTEQLVRTAAGLGLLRLFDYHRRCLCGSPLLWPYHYWPCVGSGWLSGGHLVPTRLAGTGGFSVFWSSPFWRNDLRRQSGLHGGPLHRGQKAPPR